MNKKISIIIPVYNALEQFKRCIASVLHYTDIGDYCNITIINDNSTDTNVIQYLSTIKTNNINIINHKVNLGYTKTINEGMKINHNNDIILLNSDTIVTNNWINKLKEAAYSSEDIGTVTPVSNNAGCFSVPNTGYNEVPLKYIDKISTIVEKCGKDITIDLPTGNGFCLFIKSDLIQKIGYFDDINFPRGYGEENDYCMRAYNKGYRNILLLNTYIYHEGHASFKDSRTPLEVTGIENLRILYPEYEKLIKVFHTSKIFNEIKKDIKKSIEKVYTQSKYLKLYNYTVKKIFIVRRILENTYYILYKNLLKNNSIKFFLKKAIIKIRTEKFFNILKYIYNINKKNINILFDDININNSKNTILKTSFSLNSNSICIIDHRLGGGANLFTRNKINNELQKQVNVLLLTWDLNYNLLLGIAYIKNKKIILRFKNFHDFAQIDSLFFSKIIINNLVSWQINDGRKLNSFASIPYILNDIKKIKTRTKAELEVMIHDYFCICPSYTLTNEHNEYCHVPKNLNLCNRCLNNNHELSCKPSFDFNLKLWRQAWHDIFKISTCIYLFSKSSFYILNKIFKMNEYIYMIKPHAPLINWETKIIIPKDYPMTIAVIGNISFAKGANIVYDLLNYLQEDEKIIVIGNIHMKNNKKNKKLQIHGSYKLEELPDIIKHYNITIGLIPSIWPETFSYTTQECMTLGIPTVAFNLGAQGEKIGSWKYGLLAKEYTAQSVYFALSELDSMRKCRTMN